jgi:hypothetical protein
VYSNDSVDGITIDLPLYCVWLLFQVCHVECAIRNKEPQLKEKFSEFTAFHFRRSGTNAGSASACNLQRKPDCRDILLSVTHGMQLLLQL